MRFTYGFEQLQEVSSRFVGDFLGVDGLDGRMCGHYILKGLGSRRRDVVDEGR